MSRLETGLLWLVGHGARVWPFLVFAAVLAATWEALREIHPRNFRDALGALDTLWLLAVAAATVANIAVMGFYDVVAFRHTQATWRERWRYGAVAFAWSNFLTLGPLAGPAIRFWLYRPSVDHISELHAGVAAVAIAFTSGLIGWTVTASLAAWWWPHIVVVLVGSLAVSLAAAFIGRAVLSRIERLAVAGIADVRVVELALVGWLDWLLAGTAFMACLFAAGTRESVFDLAATFYQGQAVGVASLVPGGFGSSDAFWIARLPLANTVAAAVLVAYRLIYYIAPWLVASLLLLSWLASRAPRRLEIARRIVAGLVGGGGLLIILSSATPALHVRLALVERFIPLPLVEAGQVTAALAGLLLLVLARGLARGYRAALRATMAVLVMAGAAALLKGLDWEEALVLGTLAVAAWSQAALFDRPSQAAWVEGADLAVASAAVVLFVTFGAVAHRVSADTLDRWSHIGYRFEEARFLRTAASMMLAVAAGGLYVLMRPAVRFSRPDDPTIDRTLAMNAAIGVGTTPMMVAMGDKAVLFDDDRGCVQYRTIGPYLVVFSDPVVRSVAERGALLEALFALAGELDRRPVFYQISLDWMPALHDRGYDFFKLGEEAQVHLSRVTLEGHAGKLNRQILRRAERDRVTFRILPPGDVAARLPELAEVSDDWLRTKHLAERQFSIGFFDPDYLSKFPCAVVEEVGTGRLLAFANLLEGPHQEELSIDLMRYRSGGPSVMDFLIISLLLHGKQAGYARFNLGMAPLSSVGEQQGAHARERLARLLFQRGEHWYNFQGLRQFKDKFEPEWVPRYMAYQDAWEWPVAISYVSALIAGGWGSVLFSGKDSAVGRPERTSD